VFDVTNPKSFENLDVWKNDFLVKANPKDPEHFPFFVFGNKIDMVNERKVIINTNKNS
jgi:Ras-related protein Rab-7A